jgi:hypothetical protein
MALSFSDAKKIAITDYLAQVGFEPARVRGNAYWYRSPFRSERDASFKVDAKLNLWFDHGEGVGGTLLDLGPRLHSCTTREFVTRLENSNLSVVPELPKRTTQPPETRVEILTTSPISDDTLVAYLADRKIDLSNASAHCTEVEFRIAQREYKAIGFRNDSGGYELRNSWFKGSSSPKDVTLIKNGSDNLIVTEGFIDYLSLHQLKEKGIQKEIAESDHLILNSISFMRKSLPLIKTYRKRALFLDNDQAAEKAKAFLKASSVDFVDRSSLYAKHKDINEFLVKGDVSITSSRKRSQKL